MSQRIITKLAAVAFTVTALTTVVATGSAFAWEGRGGHGYGHDFGRHYHDYRGYGFGRYYGGYRHDGDCSYRYWSCRSY